MPERADTPATPPAEAPDTSTSARRGLLPRAYDLVAETFQHFTADDVPRTAAAISYYALLALAPTLLIVNAIVALLGAKLPQTPGTQVAGTFGQAAGAYFQQISAWAGGFAPVVMAVLIVVGAVSVFTQFVTALQRIWGLEPANQSMRALLAANLLSLALLAVAALAFVAGLLVVGVLSVFGQIALNAAASLGVAVPSALLSVGLRAGLVFVAAALFLLVAFKLVPRRGTRWLDVVPGALVTALLFLLGETALAIYLGTTQRFNVFGTFEFFVVLIVWIYYTALVVLWGAEFTRLLVLAAETRRLER